MEHDEIFGDIWRERTFEIQEISKDWEEYLKSNNSGKKIEELAADYYAVCEIKRIASIFNLTERQIAEFYVESLSIVQLISHTFQWRANLFVNDKNWWKKRSINIMRIISMCALIHHLTYDFNNDKFLMDESIVNYIYSTGKDNIPELNLLNEMHYVMDVVGDINKLSEGVTEFDYDFKQKVEDEYDSVETFLFNFYSVDESQLQ